MAKGETPFTPAISLYFALEAALNLMKQEGMRNIFARHTRVATYTRTRLKQLGYPLFADEAFASETVTAIYNPPGVDYKKWRKIMREQSDTIIAGGQADLVDTISRVGHLGWVTEADIDACLDAMTAALVQVQADVVAVPPSQVSTQLA